MNARPIQQERIQTLNSGVIRRGGYVLYWMQQSQRAEWNHALEHAVECANALDQPLLVAFGLMDGYPEANLRHYAFMLEGIEETQRALAERGIKMVVRRGNPDDVALDLGRNASLIVCDRGYLRHHKAWRRNVAERALCLVQQVESDVVVPVEVVSRKREYAARTIRPKIHRHLNDYLIGMKPNIAKRRSVEMEVVGMDLSDIPATLDRLKLDGCVPRVDRFFKGGTWRAKSLFTQFVRDKLPSYYAMRSQPHTEHVSLMSPYLHFGQISPLYLALEVRKAQSISQEDEDAFLEELIVRRELAINFVHYTKDYDTISCLPDWAYETLADHREDAREPIYGKEQLERAETHDVWWNAAMKEMKTRGYLHNHLRMYWGKKILEWTRSPEEAFETALELNNRYFLDGRDPSSYTNVAWIFGLHDRPWKERPIFGKVRYMSASGLERKCNMPAYLKRVNELVDPSTPPA